MTPERWRRVTELFHAALDRSGSQVDEFLRKECGDDPELHAEVGRMLQEHARGGLLDQSPLASPQRPRVFADGQLVSGRYSIVRLLGHGGMGEVYEAEDQDLKERVALKTLLPAIAADTRMIARFKQEIQLSRKISHPNVCRVFDLARHPVDGASGDATLFLTMELLSGETLAAKLEREGRMRAEAALPLLEQMADALEAAHRAGVIHRDFKPSNVMLVASAGVARAVVTDFGLARSFSPGRETTATRTEGVPGTLDYMAPELLTGQSASAASDVYALGMVAYKMVAGALPFSADTPLAGAILRSKAPVPSPRTLVPELDAKWDRAILRALHADRMRRFSRPSDFLAALRGEGSSITVSLPVMTKRRWLAAAFLLLAVVASWIAWRGSRQARNQPSAEAAVLYRSGVDDIHSGIYFAATKALGEAVRVASHFAMAHVRLAEAWAALDLTDKAREEMLLALGEDVGGLSAIERLQIEAVRRTITKKFDEAVEAYRQMHAMAPEDTDIDLDLGRAYESASQPEAAVECYRRVADGPSHNPAAWLRLGILYDRRSDVNASDAAFLRAQQSYELTSNLEGRAEVAYRQGAAARRRGNAEEAVKLLGKALEMARLAGNTHQEIRVKLDFSNHYYEAGDTPRAEQFAREALDTARANQMEYFAIGGIVQLGNAYRGKSDFNGAEKLYQQGLEIARRTNAQRMIAVNLLSLASLHSRLGRFRETADEARQALTYYEQNRFGIEWRQCILLLGRAQRDAGDLAGARESFDSLLQMATKAGDRGSLATAYEALGSLDEANEKYPDALQEYRKELDYSSDARARSSARLSVAGILWQLGNYAEARKMLDATEAEASPFPSIRLELSQARAAMALSEGDYADARAQSREALAAATQEPPRAAALRFILGQAQIATGNSHQGVANCEEAFRDVEKQGNAIKMRRARLILALARMDAGDRAGALQLLNDLGSATAPYPESNWWVLALKARLDPRTIAEARQALDQVRKAWGDAVFQRYQSRPDIQKLSRPLFASSSAK